MEKATLKSSMQIMKEIEIQTEIVQAIKANPGVSKGGVVKIVKGNAQKIGANIDKLIEEKTIFSKVGGAKGNAIVLYADQSDIPIKEEISVSAAA